MVMAIVDELYKNHTELWEYLQQNKQPSLFSFVDNTFKKVLVLASASFFEEEIKTILMEFAAKCSSNNLPLVNFIKNKTIERQYDTYFNWKENNASSFFGLFGNKFKTESDADVLKDPTLKESIKSFLEIGFTRNILVHSNFANIEFSKIPTFSHRTAEEYYKLYQSGIYFVEYIKKKLLM